MRTIYNLGSFFAALILTACTTTGTALNINTIMSQPDRWILLAIFALVILSSAALAKISFKEIINN